MGRIFSFVDVTPEENLRKAIKTAETIAPCVFWVDEIEKGFPKSAAAGSDTSTRLLGHFLTWLQEKASPVFVFATANDISNVAPELMRRGRFDEIFFVDFPNPKERESIWRVQFKRHKQAVPEEGLDELVRLTKGFSGAEIEQALVDAMFLAFSDNRRSCQMSDLTEAIGRIKPLSESRRDELVKMAEIAERSATQASSYVPEEVTRAEVGLARELKHIKKKPDR
jgi:SpoVK/Ycf46/Vps4 family AAA+-type ATPase